MNSFFDVTLFATTFLTLSVVLDPPGNLPIFMSLTQNMDRRNQNKVAWQSSVVGLTLLLTFAAFGSYIFKFLSISLAALQVSGGLLLLLVAIQLLTGSEEDPGKGGKGVNPAVVPLGTPLLAGPGAIVAVMLSMEKTNGHFAMVLAVLFAVVLAVFVQWLFFFFGVGISRALGKGGITFLTRISGMLLAAIAVQLLAQGVLEFVEQAITKM